MSRKNALRLIRAERVRISGGICTDPQRRLKIGHHVQLSAHEAKPASPPGPELTECARGIILRHVDAQIVVVEKPAGLTTVRHAQEARAFGRRARKFLPATLVDLLPAVLQQHGHESRGRMRAVHRIDKETSGLLVLARTDEAERDLGKQFRAHSVGRHYLALVRGQAKDERIESYLVPDRGDGRRGSGDAGQGQHAVTHVRVVELLDGFSLVECRLETGRTHQVRIHLAERGTPLCGERIYDRPLHGQPIPDGSGARRPLLHAAYLALDHPHAGKRLEWRADLPPDMKKLRKKLRGQDAPRKRQDEQDQQDD